MRTQPRCLAVCLSVILNASCANATSLVVSLGKTTIILAADTRRDQRDLGVPGHRYHDDVCKIASLGPTAIAVTGNMDYKRNVDTDAVPDWNSLDDAKAAYDTHLHDLHGMAQDWAQRAVSHYQQFYQVAPQRVKDLADVNSSHVLITAFIVG
jgi:hypothetical protein